MPKATSGAIFTSANALLGPRAGDDTADVDRGQDADEEHGDHDPARARSRPRHELGEVRGEQVGLDGGGDRADEVAQPSDLQRDERSERRLREEVRAARRGESRRDLGEAEDHRRGEGRGDEPGGEARPTQAAADGAGQHEDAGADDAVEHERRHAPAAERADEHQARRICRQVRRWCTGTFAQRLVVSRPSTGSSSTMQKAAPIVHRNHRFCGALTQWNRMKENRKDCSSTSHRPRICSRGRMHRVDQPFDRAEGGPEHREHAEREEQPPEHEPPASRLEQDASQRIERQREDDAANGLEQRARHHQPIRRGTHEVRQRRLRVHLLVVVERVGQDPGDEVRHRVHDDRLDRQARERDSLRVHLLRHRHHPTPTREPDRRPAARHAPNRSASSRESASECPTRGTKAERSTSWYLWM